LFYGNNNRANTRSYRFHAGDNQFWKKLGGLLREALQAGHTSHDFELRTRTEKVPDYGGKCRGADQQDSSFSHFLLTEITRLEKLCAKSACEKIRSVP
jgi:hypothetical protein